MFADLVVWRKNKTIFWYLLFQKINRYFRISLVGWFPLLLQTFGSLPRNNKLYQSHKDISVPVFWPFSISSYNSSFFRFRKIPTFSSFSRLCVFFCFCQLAGCWPSLSLQSRFWIFKHFPENQSFFNIIFSFNSLFVNKIHCMVSHPYIFWMTSYILRMPNLLLLWNVHQQTCPKAFATLKSHWKMAKSQEPF